MTTCCLGLVWRVVVVADAAAVVVAYLVGIGLPVSLGP